MSKKQDFHITVGIGAIENSHDITYVVEHHVRLAKAALLYADKVTLCSPMASPLVQLSAMRGFTDRQLVDLLGMMAPSLSRDEETVENANKFCSVYREVSSGRRPSIRQLQIKAQMRRAIQPQLDILLDKATEIFNTYKLDQLDALFKTKRMKLQPLGPRLSAVQVIAQNMQKAAAKNSILETGYFDVPLLPGNTDADWEATMGDFLKELERVINDPQSYPLFDDFTGDLVRLGIEAERINVSETQTDRVKPTGLAADLMERLPTFDSASVDEIMDIRNELSKPLIGFRAAMIKFSADIKTTTWDKDFPLEAEKVFRAEVEPAVTEIEDSVQSNKWLIELSHLLPEKPLNVPAGGVLGAGFSVLSQLPEVWSTSIGAVAGMGLMALEARQKWAAKQSEIENNQLFFYYKAGKLLERNRR